MRRLFMFVAGAFALLTSAANADPAAEALADKMLAAVGGRAGWAEAVSTVNDSQQNRPDEPRVVRAVISMEFDRPRFRIDTTTPDLHVIRVVDGESSWRTTRDGTVLALEKNLYEEDMRWYRAHVYRTLHRVARRDPEITLQVGEGGRLEVLENGERIVWYKLDSAGEPYAFGFYDDDRGSLCGPWEFVNDGLKQPVWVSSADGTWRAMVKGFEADADFDETLFARPQ